MTKRYSLLLGLLVLCANPLNASTEAAPATTEEAAAPAKPSKLEAAVTKATTAHTKAFEALNAAKNNPALQDQGKTGKDATDEEKAAAKVCAKAEKNVADLVAKVEKAKTAMDKAIAAKDAEAAKAKAAADKQAAIEEVQAWLDDENATLNLETLKKMAYKVKAAGTDSKARNIRRGFNTKVESWRPVMNEKVTEAVEAIADPGNNNDDVNKAELVTLNASIQEMCNLGLSSPRSRGVPGASSSAVHDLGKDLTKAMSEAKIDLPAIKAPTAASTTAGSTTTPAIGDAGTTGEVVNTSSTGMSNSVKAAIIGGGVFAATAATLGALAGVANRKKNRNKPASQVSRSVRIARALGLAKKVAENK